MTSRISLPPDYFDAMYAGSPDPWGFRDRWYESRKRAVTMASLPQARYTRAFEPGCSLGMLTTELAARCDVVLAYDPSPAAVDAARAAVNAHSNVEVRRGSVPADWPDGAFDLVVLSEVAYYLDPGDLTVLVERCIPSLVEGGTLLACHWRHEVQDYPATGDQVHEVLGERPELHRVVHHLEDDFVLDVWSHGRTPSVAHREGLVG